MFNNNYDPMKIIKEIRGRNANVNQANKNIAQDFQENDYNNEEIDLEQNIKCNHSDFNNQNTNDEFFYKKSKKPRNLKRNIFIFIIIVLIAIGIYAFIVIRDFYLMPFEGTYEFGDTPVTITATYNSKYDIAKINLELDEIAENWQVKLTNGNIPEIIMQCETSDNTVKREYKFKDISLIEGEKIHSSISIENVKLKEFFLIKELLSGSVGLSVPRIISLTSDDRESIKKLYTSGAWIWGLLWANQLLGGY